MSLNKCTRAASDMCWPHTVLVQPNERGRDELKSFDKHRGHDRDYRKLAAATVYIMYNNYLHRRQHNRYSLDTNIECGNSDRNHLIFLKTK